MKRINLLLTLMLTCSIISFGASVPVNTAKNAGYNFLAQHDVALTSAGDLQLIYTSAKNNTYFYVFGNSMCFVIIAADDAAQPVLAYSFSNGFRADNMPTNLSGVLDDYNVQMENIISNNIAATPEITAQWNDLVQNIKHTAAKTTATVTPLLTTTWDQAPYYNGLCPVDAGATSSAGRDVTGCVATAMSQVMKFWNWPVKGISSSSYTSNTNSYNLSADYSSTVYHWNLMPNSISSANPAIATLMSDAGISVDMDYTAAESGAFVTEMSVPSGTPCAELALKTYFNYKSTLHGIKRGGSGGMSTTAWTDSIEADIALGHPVLVDGQGTDGGHNFVFDGFDATNKFHVNWGWSGTSDGYFAVNALNPSALGIGGGSGGGFNSSNHAIIGIVPNGTPAIAPLPDIYESDNTAASAYNLPITWTSAPYYNTGKAGTPGSNFHIGTDIDYYKIVLPAGLPYNITARVNDAYSSNDTISYTGDAMWAYSMDGGSTWSTTYDSTKSTPIYVANTGASIIFRVVQHYAGTTGSYLLNISKIQAGFPTTINGPEMDAARIFPNPAADIVNVDLTGTNSTAVHATLTDVEGKTVYSEDVNNAAVVSIPVQAYPAGIYILNVATTKGALSKEVSVK